MLNLAVLDPDTAPPQTKETLAEVKRKYGFLPNLYGIFAHSPAPLQAYLGISAAFEQSSFSPLERNVILLATARANDCRYCVAVHSTMGDMQRHPTDITDAIRNDTPIADARLEALRRFTQAVVVERGRPGDSALQAFLKAGYSEVQVLEVIVGVTLKTLSNYVNHVADTPLDKAFEARRFQPR